MDMHKHREVTAPTAGLDRGQETAGRVEGAVRPPTRDEADGDTGVKLLKLFGFSVPLSSPRARCRLGVSPRS